MTAAPSLDEIPSWPAAVSVPVGGSAFGLSPSTSYDLVARGEFPAKVIKVGGRYRVLTASILRVLTAEG